MVFDATINLGNVITLGVTIVGGFWAYHKWDVNIELRHQQNKNQFENLEYKIDNVNQKVDRVEGKVDETKKDVNGTHHKIATIDAKIEKHLTADDLIQKETLRHLERIDDKIDNKKC